MKLTKRQRENLSKNFYDVGKLVLGIVVLGLLVSKEPFTFSNLIMIILGFIIVILCFVIATILDKGDKND